jgi:hypothetical protein
LKRTALKNSYSDKIWFFKEGERDLSSIYYRGKEDRQRKEIKGNSFSFSIAALTK